MTDWEGSIWVNGCMDCWVGLLQCFWDGYLPGGKSIPCDN